MLQILLQVYKFVWGSGAVRETKWYFPNQHILKPLIHARYSFSRYSPSACCVPGMREMEAAMLYKKKRLTCVLGKLVSRRWDKSVHKQDISCTGKQQKQFKIRIMRVKGG